MAWWAAIPAIAQVAGSLFSASQANKTAQSSADAQTSANQAAIDLQRQIYGDQRSLSMPNYLIGGDATNKLARIYGLRPQDFNAAAAGRFSPATYGNPVASNVGAQSAETAQRGPMQGMVAGLTGSDPSLINALSTGNVGTWWAEGGPSILSRLGSKVVGHNLHDPLGLFTDKPRATDNYDEWGTLSQNATNAGAADWGKYLTDNPDVAQWASTLKEKDRRGYDILAKSYDLDRSGDLSPGEMAQAHYYSIGGQREGRALTTPEQSARTALEASSGNAGATTGAGTGGATGTATGGTATPSQDATDPMADFWASGHGQLATNAFLGVDNPAIKAAYSTAGQAMSGAQLKALQDRGKARAEGAFSNYLGGLNQLAGFGSSAGSQISSNAGAYGANVSNALMNNGQVAGQLAATRNANWQNAMNDAAGTAYGYAKSQGWLK